MLAFSVEMLSRKPIKTYEEEMMIKIKSNIIIENKISYQFNLSF